MRCRSISLRRYVSTRVARIPKVALTETHLAQAFVFFREFILGNNQTGLVSDSSGSVQVVGGEASSLQNGILPGTSGIIYGSGSELSTAFYPSATVAAWDAFIATAAPGSAQSSGSLSMFGTENCRSVERCWWAGLLLQLTFMWFVGVGYL
jgi:carboxypeptidase D